MSEKLKNNTGSSGAAKVLRYLRDRGPNEFAAHAAEKIHDRRFDYQKWVRAGELSPFQAGYQRSLKLDFMPRVYVMIARVSRDPDSETTESIKTQTYRNTSIADALTTHIDNDAYILIIPDHARLSDRTVFEMVNAMQEPVEAGVTGKTGKARPEIVYSDSDFFSDDSGRVIYSEPVFKPDYNHDYLRSANYIGYPFLIRCALMRSVFSEEGTGAPDAFELADPSVYYDLVLRCTYAALVQGSPDGCMTSRADGILHIPRILCHLRRDTSSGGFTERMREVLSEDLVRRGAEGLVADGALPDTYHISYRLKSEPLVSVIIPNKDNSSVLENCVWSIINRSSWKRYEIVVIENNSEEKETFEFYETLEKTGRARVVRYNGVFNFSKIINEGVKQAKGEYIVLMNNDVTVKTPDWIEKLLAHCQRKGVGAAGPKLLFPDGRVQSAGIVAGIMGFAGSMMVGEAGDDPGYMGRACLTQDMSALTAACLMVRKDTFRSVGGFDQNLAVALNDVDFCLRLVEKGYRNVFEPEAVMIHHESLTRGLDFSGKNKARLEREKKIFRKRWAGFLRKGDPAYNPNLSRRRCDWSQQT